MTAFLLSIKTERLHEMHIWSTYTFHEEKDVIRSAMICIADILHPDSAGTADKLHAATGNARKILDLIESGKIRKLDKFTEELPRDRNFLRDPGDRKRYEVRRDELVGKNDPENMDIGSILKNFANSGGEEARYRKLVAEGTEFLKSGIESLSRSRSANPSLIEDIRFAASSIADEDGKMLNKLIERSNEISMRAEEPESRTPFTLSPGW